MDRSIIIANTSAALDYLLCKYRCKRSVTKKGTYLVEGSFLHMYVLIWYLQRIESNYMLRRESFRWQSVARTVNGFYE